MKVKQNTQKTDGLHFILSVPLIYQAIQFIFKHEQTERRFSDFIGEKRNKRILDIGCGIGFDSQKYSDAFSYTGLDLSQKYIDHARQFYGDYGSFYCCSVDEMSNLNLQKFDIVLLKGVLHHLADEQINNMVKTLRNHVTQGAIFVAVDPTFYSGQNFIAKWLISNDRGKNVKNKLESAHFLKSLFADFQSTHTKQFIPPYDRLIVRGIFKI